MFGGALQSGALGALFTFASSPVYPLYARRTAALGLSALADQQLGRHLTRGGRLEPERDAAGILRRLRCEVAVQDHGLRAGCHADRVDQLCHEPRDEGLAEFVEQLRPPAPDMGHGPISGPQGLDDRVGNLTG